jgi:hypothetical protein
MNVSAAAMAAAPVAVEALNPIELLIASFNTNPYFIGLMMLFMNLGGRFLAMEVTKGQEKFFQNPWIRRLLIFTVIFIATRNIFVAFWLSLVVILIVGVLFNENSALFVLAPQQKKQAVDSSGNTTSVLTPEEADMYRKLTDKLAKNTKQDSGEIDYKTIHSQAQNTYTQNMQYVQTMFS